MKAFTLALISACAFAANDTAIPDLDLSGERLIQTNLTLADFDALYDQV